MSRSPIVVRLTRAQADEVLAALSNWRLGLWDNHLNQRAAVCGRAHRAVAQARLDAPISTLRGTVKE